eukprot:2710449-Amphidinium_carterae.2
MFGGHVVLQTQHLQHLQYQEKDHVPQKVRPYIAPKWYKGVKARRMFCLAVSILSRECGKALDSKFRTLVIPSHALLEVALAAWQEFVGYAKKLERYSSVAAALENHLTWWQSLRPFVSLLSNVNLLAAAEEKLPLNPQMVWKPKLS